MMEPKVYKDVGIISLNLDADDEEGYPMLSQHLERCRAFYAECKSTENGKMVIHCQAGINRSGVITAAIYMLEEQMHVLDVVKHIRRRRGNCYLWNVSFQKQLIALAKKNGLLGPKPGFQTFRMMNTKIILTSLAKISLVLRKLKIYSDAKKLI